MSNVLIEYIRQLNSPIAEAEQYLETSTIEPAKGKEAVQKLAEKIKELKVKNAALSEMTKTCDESSEGIQFTKTFKAAECKFQYLKAMVGVLKERFDPKTSLERLEQKTEKSEVISADKAQKFLDHNFPIKTYLDNPLETTSHHACGLRNAGNNCFINAAWTLIVHTKSLDEAFIRFAYAMSTDQDPNNRRYGLALASEYVKYRHSCDLKHPSHPALTNTQRVREAFKHFFGNLSRFDDGRTQEDSAQIFVHLLAGYERVCKNTGSPSPLYTQRTIRRKFLRTQLPLEKPTPGKTYAAIGADLKLDPQGEVGYTEIQHPDSVVYIDLDRKTHLPFLPFHQIILDTFCSDQSTNPSQLAKYLDPETNQLYTFSILSENYSFEKAPPELILVPKWFRFDPNTSTTVKIDKEINIPLVLTLPPEATNSHQSFDYDLTGFVVHSGSGANGGHYFSYKKFQNVWFKFNDTVVTTVQKEEIDNILQHNIGGTAYVLHYRLCAQQKPSAPSMADSLLSRSTIDGDAREQELSRQISTIQSHLATLLQLDALKRSHDSWDSFVKNRNNQDLISLFHWLLWMKDEGQPIDNYGKIMWGKISEKSQFFQVFECPAIPLFVSSGSQNFMKQIDSVFKTQLAILEEKQAALRIAIKLQDCRKSLDEAIDIHTLNGLILGLQYINDPNDPKKTLFQRLASCVYLSHIRTKGAGPVHASHYNVKNEYGTDILLSDECDKALREATAPIVSVHGKNVLQQLEYEAKQRVRAIDNRLIAMGLELLLKRFQQAPSLNNAQLASCLHQFTEMGLITQDVKNKILTHHRAAQGPVQTPKKFEEDPRTIALPNGNGKSYLEDLLEQYRK